MQDKQGKKTKKSELLTPTEAARKLGVTYCTLNSWRAKGCPHELVDTGLREAARYNLDDVRAWQRKHRADMAARRKSAV